MTQFARGISPDLLVSQVRSTMPYLFDAGPDSDLAKFQPAQILRQYAAAPTLELSHLDYFKLCVSAHYSSCGTPVPTDVDNQIRHKLWPKNLPLETALAMADFVLGARAWDYRLVSSRFTYGAKGSPQENDSLDGHLGEWFTIAAGAYCALKPYSANDAKAKRAELFDAIRDEVNHHSEVFGSLWRAEDGLGALTASAAVAHNFGDLDRVIDMWELDAADPLRIEFYKLGVLPFDSNRKLRFQGRLWVAGELYKEKIEGTSMAAENHRHFALRKPRCLRSRAEALVPVGPFFDDWGSRVARLFPEADAYEVVTALMQGWTGLGGTVGYGRAVHGITTVYPSLMPEPIAKSYRNLITIPRDRFEAKFRESAVRALDEIPSRA